MDTLVAPTEAPVATAVESKAMQAVRYLGGHARERGDDRSGIAAAILPLRVTREELDAIYKKLAPHARMHPLLTRKWKVYAVLATDEWTQAHQHHKSAP